MLLLFIHLLISFIYNTSECTKAEETNDDYRIFNEGSYCMPITVDTTMHWYGIYRTINVDSLIEVKLQPIKTWEEGNMTWSTIATNRSKTSQALFIIGSKKALKNKVVSRYEMYSSHFIYPGMTYPVYSINTLGNATGSFALTATGNVIDVGYCPKIENYKLWLSLFPSFENPQDLTDYFPYKGECGMFQIVWFGDLDDDDIPDMIFVVSGNSGGEVKLFLSSESKNGKHIELVAQLYTQSCC